MTPIALDITDAERVAQVAAQCPDVSLLVNNAGVMKASTFIGAPNLDAARLEMETNYFGTLSMCRAFAPVLAANGGGAIVNMLSVSSFYTNPFTASYGASKAAALVADQRGPARASPPGHAGGRRARQLHRHRHGGPGTRPKDSPESVAQQAFDAVEAGQVEVLADERTRTVKAQLSRDHELIYPPVQEFWDAAVGGTS